MKSQKTFKITAAAVAAILGAASLTSCSMPWVNKPQEEPAAATMAATEAPPSADPETAIVGKWEISEITDKNGSEVNLSDVDLSGTPLANYASVIGMVLKTGVTLEFKADKTIPLVITSGQYEIDDNKLKISIPSISSNSITADCEINGNTMTLIISGYTISLAKK